MRKNIYQSCAMCALMGLALPLFGQMMPGQTAATCKNTPSLQSAPYKPQPYTAEFKTTTVQTLADGVTITRETTETTARDSAGRNMSTTTEETPQFGRSPGTSGFANDPVAGTQSNWDSRTKTATILKLPPKDQRHGCWGSDAGFMRIRYGSSQPTQQNTAHVQEPQRKTTTEDLGEASIQGLEAHGIRSTYTIPAGEVGNDQPLVTISEQWTALIARGSSLEVRSLDEDPRTGTRTRELVNLTLDEPDPSVFQPPEDYKVNAVELHQIPCQQ